MSDRSAIEWTDATWNPVRARSVATGRVGWHCEHVSEGCRGCYAESFNRRLGTGLPYKPGHVVRTNRSGERRGDAEVYLDERMLLLPLRWKRRRRIFAGSMTDLFADFVTDAMLDRIFAVASLCPQHILQFLTKRPDRMRDYFADPMVKGRIQNVVDYWECEDDCPFDGHAPWVIDPWPLPNVWLGTSIEDQAAADERIPLLLATPAAVRFLSCEPLLGPVDISAFLSAQPTAGSKYHFEPSHHWVIAGGESGAGARPMHPDWARSLRDQCGAAGVPFFFKQWGNFKPTSDCNGPYMMRASKKEAGRLLDGVEHNGMPGAAA